MRIAHMLRSDPARPLGPRLAGLFMGAAVIGVAALLFGNILAVMLGPEPPGPGDAAPPFRAASPHGEVSSLGDYRGRVVLLDFWHMACPGCVGATPKLNRLQDRFGPDGFTVLALSQDHEEVPEVLDFMARRAIEYRVLMDDGDIADAYGVYAFPTVFLLDRDGTIRHSYRGAVTERTLATRIEALLDDAPGAPRS